MAEPFKNMIREETIRELADLLAAAGPLDVDAFVSSALNGLEELELKDRVRHISTLLRQHLDADFRIAIAQILRALPPSNATAENAPGGFVLWPLCQFVEDHGVADPDTSLPALYELTRRFSGEFAIRPFLLQHTQRTLDVLEEWADDEDQHVRRLVSEGCRPRLPWGQRLHFLVEDPSPILPLLEKLRDDPEEYVRRSVANNLNDIAKDNPEVVVSLCRRWLKNAPKDRQRLVRHALRSLVKQGHSGALELLGFGPPAVEILRFVGPEKATIGETIQLELHFRNTLDHPQNLVIDYALDSPGARGNTTRKVFKWRTTEAVPGTNILIRHTHSFRPVTTRATRPGTYKFELLINGQGLGEHTLVLDQ